MSKFYKIPVHCSNCGLAEEIEIKLRKLVKNWKCPRCECRTLSRSSQDDLHALQEKLLLVINQVQVSGMTLRQIGEFIELSNPQQVVHHLEALEKRGLITWNKKLKKIAVTNLGKIKW